MSARAERSTRPVRTPGNPPGLRDLPFALPEVTDAEKRRARRVYAALAELHPDAHCELAYTSPHELLIATILSAQATDAGVNRATPGLFARFPTPADYAAATPAEIEPYIKTIGLFRNKAKSVHAAMTRIVEEFGGEVPRTVDELTSLRGVARKTAGVVLGEAFGINDVVVVDTHVERVSKKLRLVPEEATVAMTERRLMALIPRKNWMMLSHLLIFHGRRVSKARGSRDTDDPVYTRYVVRGNESPRRGEGGAKVAKKKTQKETTGTTTKKRKRG